MFVRVSVILAVVCVFLSLVYYQYNLQQDEHLPGIEERTATELKRVYIADRPSLYQKVAVGTNANVDLIISGVALLRQLNVSANEQEVECSEVSSLEELEQCFSYFMAKGAAAERAITLKELSDKIINAASGLAGAQYSVGGNAALIGLKLTELLPNAQVMLCGPVGPKLKSLLSDAVIVPESCRAPGDEHHLILEYQRNEKWRENRAPIANRFIMSHDVANSAMSSLEPFIDETLIFKPDLVVVSGFHLLNGNDDQLWRERLSAAARAFAGLPKSVPVHLELASMNQCHVIKEIVKQIIPLVDSIGLNEQELIYISKCMNGLHSNITAVDSTDEIGYYSDMVRWLLQEYGKNSKQFPESRLSRVHFHCLYVHLLAVLPSHWKSNEASVTAGSWTAYSQACQTDVASSEQAELRIPDEFRQSLSSSQTIRFNPSKPIVSFTSDNIHIFIAPVLVCKLPVKTVGLGDAISATGLLYNVFIE